MRQDAGWIDGITFPALWRQVEPPLSQASGDDQCVLSIQ